MRLFKPDTTFYDNYVDKGKFLLTWRLNMLFLIIFGILTPCFIFIKPEISGFYIAVLVCALAGIIYLKKKKKYTPVFWLFTICATIINTISLFIVTELVHYTDLFWVVTIVIFAFVGLGRRTGMFFIAFNSLAITVHVILFLNSNIRLHYVHSLAERIGTTVELIFALFAIAYLMNEYLKFQSYAERRLKKVNDGLGKKERAGQ